MQSSLHWLQGDNELWKCGNVDIIVAQVIKREHTIVLRDARDNEILRKTWEATKVKLSRIPTADMKLTFPGLRELIITVTRDDFETKCSGLFAKIAHEVVITKTKAQVR